LQGMFSFVLYDERKNKIIAARDIAGEKPLFYLKTEHELIFCSELKGILKNKRAWVTRRATLARGFSFDARNHLCRDCIPR